MDKVNHKIYQTRQQKMSNRDRTIIKHLGFEVICYPDTLQKFRANKLTPAQTYITPTIFKNASKGDVANSEALNKAFKTSDQTQCLLIILNKGNYNLTTKELRNLKEQKRREIIHYIHKNFLNPQTNYPWPLSVIETAINDSKMPIDYTKSVSSQFCKFKSKIVTKLPLKTLETLTGKLLIPYKSWNKKGVQPHIRSSTIVTKEDYGDKGVSLEISLNQQKYDTFSSILSYLTNRDFTFVSLDEAKKLASNSKTTSNKYKSKTKGNSRATKRRNLLG